VTDREGVDVVDLVARLGQAGKTLAVAESLTGGLVMATLTDVPGVSEVLRGGAVVYATDTKASELGVDAGLLAERGPVDPEVALAMARGVRVLWSADLGLATTGVAGPDPQGGHPVGEVYVAVADASDGQVISCPVPQHGTGQTPDRGQVRSASVQASLGLLRDWIGR
jgi:nicotinamide-nucleotide amidase